MGQRGGRREGRSTSEAPLCTWLQLYVCVPQWVGLLFGPGHRLAEGTATDEIADRGATRSFQARGDAVGVHCTMYNRLVFGRVLDR